jgi:energy-coupling factor transporter ATP-binding protein EcfA2
MNGKRFLSELRLRNFLSYGENTPSLHLEPLNVFIGPNASGKSNLLEAIGLLAATPRDLVTPIQRGGGVGDWLWKGKSDNKIPTAEIETVDIGRMRRSSGDSPGPGMSNIPALVSGTGRFRMACIEGEDSPRSLSYTTSANGITPKEVLICRY